MTKSKKLLLISALVILVTLSCVLAAFYVAKQREETLEILQNDALAELEERRGEYDDYKIVLSSTSHSEAKALAEKLGASLRITKDGSFATLTLTDGRTIRDVYADDNNRKYISSFSADYQAKISDRHDVGENNQNKFLIFFRIQLL